MLQRIFNLNFLKDIECREASNLNQMKKYRKSNPKQGASKKLKTYIKPEATYTPSQKSGVQNPAKIQLNRSFCKLLP